MIKNEYTKVKIQTWPSNSPSFSTWWIKERRKMITRKVRSYLGLHFISDTPHLFNNGWTHFIMNSYILSYMQTNKLSGNENVIKKTKMTTCPRLQKGGVLTATQKAILPTIVSSNKSPHRVEIPEWLEFSLSGLYCKFHSFNLTTLYVRN